MDTPEDYVLVSVFDPGIPSFVSGEVEYLGSRRAAEQINNAGIRVPKKLVFKGKREVVLRQWRHEHDNCWGFQYKLKADYLRAIRYYFRVEKDYVRAIQLYFHGLKYYSVASKKWNPLDASSCWGNPGVLDETESDGFFNTVLMIDKRFKMLPDVKADMAVPQPLDYSKFFNEVFADG